MLGLCTLLRMIRALRAPLPSPYCWFHSQRVSLFVTFKDGFLVGPENTHRVNYSAFLLNRFLYRTDSVPLIKFKLLRATGFPSAQIN
ncbi:hypothetical protein EBR25_13460 [bacterium]|nr:hypothetical protein [bacterium]